MADNLVTAECLYCPCVNLEGPEIEFDTSYISLYSYVFRSNEGSCEWNKLRGMSSGGLWC
jgi:hypothetical protein